MCDRTTKPSWIIIIIVIRSEEDDTCGASRGRHPIKTYAARIIIINSHIAFWNNVARLLSIVSCNTATSFQTQTPSNFTELFFHSVSVRAIFTIPRGTKGLRGFPRVNGKKNVYLSTGKESVKKKNCNHLASYDRHRRWLYSRKNDDDDDDDETENK